MKNFRASGGCGLTLFFSFGLGLFGQFGIQVGMVFFQQGGDFHIFFVDFRQIDAFDMDEAEQFAYGFGHFAAGFVARASRLGNADLAPEVYLVQPGLFTDGFNIFYIFIKLPLSLSGCGANSDLLCFRNVPGQACFYIIYHICRFFQTALFVFMGRIRPASGFAGGGADGEDFVAGFGHQDFVFPLGGEGAVFGNHRPAVVEDTQVAFALVDHRFDGKNHTRF